MLYWYPSVTNSATNHWRPFDCLCPSKDQPISGLGRKNTWKTFKTFHFVLIFCIKKSYIHIIMLYLLFFIGLSTYLHIFFIFLLILHFFYLLRNLVEKWSPLLVIKIISSLYFYFLFFIFLVYFKLLGIVLWSYHLEKALHDSISRHFIRLLWLDQTALTGTGMWRFLNGTLL